MTQDQSKVLQLASTNKVFQLAVKNAFNHIIITDTDGKILYANSAVERITGFPLNEVMGQTPRLWGRQMDQDLYKELWRTIKEEKKSFVGEFQNKRKNGALYYAKAVISPIIDEAGALVGFIGTEEDVTKEKEVDRMKTEFISIAAHQLKTPMAALNWNLELLSGEDETPLTEKQKEYVSNMNQVTKQLGVLVDSLLNVSRMESGRLAVNPVEVDLKQLVEEVMNVHAHKAQEKQITSNLEFDPVCQNITGDPDLIREIYANLVSNAIKYTPQSGTVTVKVSSAGNESVMTEVVDTGCGIPADQQHRVFEKFFRSDKSREMAEGTGLGLYFVRLLVEACGGTISFESVEDKGTTFRFSLPIRGVEKREGEVSITPSKG